jgi:hypothetical protein
MQDGKGPRNFFPFHIQQTQLNTICLSIQENQFLWIKRLYLWRGGQSKETLGWNSTLSYNTYLYVDIKEWYPNMWTSSSLAQSHAYNK